MIVVAAVGAASAVGYYGPATRLQGCDVPVADGGCQGGHV